MNSRDVNEIILVEDAGWKLLRPLTWLRPAGALLVGARTAEERWERAAGRRPLVHCRPSVAALRPNWTADLPRDRAPRLWVRDRLIADAAWMRTALEGPGSAAWTLEDRIVAVRTEAVPTKEAKPDDDGFWNGLAKGGATQTLPAGSLLNELPDLIRESQQRIAADLEEGMSKAGPTDLGDAKAYAPERIAVEPDCRLDAGVVLDAREGPIRIGRGTKIFPHTSIRGPFGCRDECLLLGGRIGEGSYFGPRCRVHGEVEASTFHGFVNKAHDGFVGHSYVAEWVNLGALTTTSDLKNNYGTIKLDAYGRQIDSKLQKVGSFVGDHAKTRIGTMLNTGSVIGVASNLFGHAGLFPKWIPDFLWGVGEDASEYALDLCLQTVGIVLSRRGETMGQELQDLLWEVFVTSREERRTYLSAARSTTRG